MLNKRVQYFQGFEAKMPRKFSTLDLAKCVEQINDFYKDDIINQQSMQALVNFYFDNKSRAYFRNQFMFFLAIASLHVYQINLKADIEEN